MLEAVTGLCRRGPDGSLPRRLVELKATTIVGPLIGVLKSNRWLGGGRVRNHGVRTELMRIVRTLGGTAAIPVLRATAAGPDASLANEAAKQLGELRCAEAVPELRGIFERFRYCHFAAIALGKIGTPDAVRAVLEHSDKCDAEVFRHLARASDPELYDRIAASELAAIAGQGIPERIEELSKRLRVPVHLHGELPAKLRVKTCSAGNKRDALGALDRLHQILNGHREYRYSWYIQGGAIRFAPLDQVRRFWRDWAASRD